jgi:hypothetical protein
VCAGCGPASGPALPGDARALLKDVFSQPPEKLTVNAMNPVRALESFHRDLVAGHLERDLRSPRVIREATREVAR